MVRGIQKVSPELVSASAPTVITMFLTPLSLRLLLWLHHGPWSSIISPVSHFLNIFSDCPGRPDVIGYSGDMNVFSTVERYQTPIHLKRLSMCPILIGFLTMRFSEVKDSCF